jgi:hypothetical protein
MDRRGLKIALRPGRAGRRLAGTTGLVALIAVAALAIGCGGSDDPPPEQPLPPQSTAGPPKLNETLQEAVRRIEETLSSGDCEQINELNPSSRPNLSTEERCRALQGLSGLEVEAKAAYGDVAAVVDYRRGDRIVSALLVGESDGRFHIAFIDSFRGVRSVGTPRARELDLAAERAVRALRREDCEAFLEVAFRRFGFGGGTDAEVCERIPGSPVAMLDPEAAVRLEPLGGNAGYAFYGIDTRDAYLTVIAAQQPETGLPDTVPEEVARLPAGAPEYGYLDALLTRGDFLRELLMQ